MIRFWAGVVIVLISRVVIALAGIMFDIPGLDSVALGVAFLSFAMGVYGAWIVGCFLGEWTCRIWPCIPCWIIGHEWEEVTEGEVDNGFVFVEVARCSDCGLHRCRTSYRSAKPVCVYVRPETSLPFVSQEGIV